MILWKHNKSYLNMFFCIFWTLYMYFHLFRAIKVLKTGRQVNYHKYFKKFRQCENFSETLRRALLKNILSKRPSDFWNYHKYSADSSYRFKNTGTQDNWFLFFTFLSWISTVDFFAVGNKSFADSVLSLKIAFSPSAENEMSQTFPNSNLSVILKLSVFIKNFNFSHTFFWEKDDESRVKETWSAYWRSNQCQFLPFENIEIFHFWRFHSFTSKREPFEF